MSRKPGRVSCAFRLDADVHAALKQAADERLVSMNLLVSAALRDYLPRLIPVDEVRYAREHPSDG